MPVAITSLSVTRNALGEWVSGKNLPDGTYDIINFRVGFTLIPPLTGKTLSSECFINGGRIGDAWEPAPVSDEDAGSYEQKGSAQLRFELPQNVVFGHTFALRFILDGEGVSRNARFYTKEEILPRNIVRILAMVGGVVFVGGVVYYKGGK